MPDQPRAIGALIKAIRTPSTIAGAHRQELVRITRRQTQLAHIPPDSVRPLAEDSSPSPAPTPATHLSISPCTALRAHRPFLHTITEPIPSKPIPRPRERSRLSFHTPARETITVGRTEKAGHVTPGLQRTRQAIENGLCADPTINGRTWDHRRSFTRPPGTALSSWSAPSTRPHHTPSTVYLHANNVR